MKRTTAQWFASLEHRQIGNLVVMIVVAITFVTLIIRAGTAADRPVAADPTVVSTKGPTGTASETSSPAPSPTVSATPTTIGSPSLGQLKQQFNQLAEAYYLYRPEDTATSRETRTMRVAMSPVVSLMEFELRESQAYERIRVRGNLTIRPTINNLVLRPMDDDRTYVIVAAEIARNLYMPDGTISGPYSAPLTVTSYWRPAEDGWELTQYYEGGD